MKSLRSLVVLSLFLMMLSSCSAWSRLTTPKRGCGTNGKNVGAEQLLSTDKPPKAKKFKA